MTYRFTIKTKAGDTYYYEGTVDDVARHLELNKPMGVEVISKVEKQ